VTKRNKDVPTSLREAIEDVTLATLMMDETLPQYHHLGLYHDGHSVWICPTCGFQSNSCWRISVQSHYDGDYCLRCVGEKQISGFPKLEAQIAELPYITRAKEPVNA
jgi:hypothetical protein